jgi:Mrp family chromosome partitioning ATPase
MWRGLMLTKAVEQFLRDVQWGDLDYLLIDMPPGTGDVQMGLARMLPSTELLVVTTPALAAQKVAQRAADMAQRSFLKVIGVIENMSAFVCDHGESYALFGEGGGQALADAIGRRCSARCPSKPRWPPAATPVSRCRSSERAWRPMRSARSPSASSPTSLPRHRPRTSTWPAARPASSSPPAPSSRRSPRHRRRRPRR